MAPMTRANVRPRTGSTSPHTVRIGGCLIAVLLLLAATGQATSGPHAGGGILRADSPDVAMPYESPSAIAICFIDLDGSAHYSPGDSVVLTFQASCSGTSDSRDIRLASWGEHLAGDLLRTAPDRGLTLQSLSPEPRFYSLDRDGTNTLSPADTVYLRMHNAESVLVSTADVRITPYEDFPAGSQVRTGDPDVNLGVVLLGTPGERIRHVDVLETNAFSGRDAVYLTSDTTRTAAGYGDVRIRSPEDTLPYGAFLAPGDPDATGAVRNVVRHLCFLDTDGSGAYTPGEAVYLGLRAQCAGNVEAGDLRLTATGSAAGTRVAAGDDDHGAAYTLHDEARVRYVDEDADGQYSSGDLVIVNLVTPSQATVRAGDLLLTPTDRGAGVLLESGDPLLGTTLRDLWMFHDMVRHIPAGAFTTLSTGDPIYLTGTSNTGQSLQPLDVRLFATDELPFGGPVGPATGEMRAEITRGNAVVCSTRTIPGDYLPGEPVYLRMTGNTCPDTVQAGLVRLVPVDDHEAFTVVRAGDTDIARLLHTPTVTPQLRFISIGESTWSKTGQLYLNLITPDEERVRAGDIRLTPAGEGRLAGRAVLNEDGDTSLTGLTTLGVVSLYVGYVNVDRADGFGVSDLAYFTPTATQTHVAPLSVRLTTLPAPFVAPDVDGGNGETPPGSPPDSPPGGAPPGDGDGADGDDAADGGDDADASGPGALAALLAIGAALLLRRRRATR